MDATLVLASTSGRREVNINDFYHGYKQLDLQPGELIAEIRMPLPAADEQLRLYKVLAAATSTSPHSPPPSACG